MSAVPLCQRTSGPREVVQPICTCACIVNILLLLLLLIIIIIINIISSISVGKVAPMSPGSRSTSERALLRRQTARRTRSRGSCKRHITVINTFIHGIAQRHVPNRTRTRNCCRPLLSHTPYHR